MTHLTQILIILSCTPIAFGILKFAEYLVFKRRSINYQIMELKNGKYRAQRSYGWFGEWETLGDFLSEVQANKTIFEDMKFYAFAEQPINGEIKRVKEC